jgi:hypothetical protein
MSEFNPFDDQLAQALKGRAGSGSTSVAGAHEAVLARAGHIRRRRAATIGTVAMLALLIGGVVLLPRGGGDTLAPSDTGDVLPSVDVDRSAVETTLDDDLLLADATSTTSENAPSTLNVDPTPSSTGSVVTTTDPGVASIETETSVTAITTAGGTTPPISGTTPTSVSVSTPVSPTTTDDGSSTTSTDSSTSTSEASPPPVAPFDKTYPSLGGSITVSWNGSAFSLLAVAPAAGFEQEIENNEPLRIRVRFRSDDDESRIEVRLSDGVLIETIS